MTCLRVELGELVEFLDHKRRPITEKDREAGPFPYYGANGQQDSVAGYIFDEPLVLLAEDGGHFDDPSRGIAYRVSGKCWVNNHAHVLRPNHKIDWGYLCRVLENADVSRYISGTTRAKLTKAGAAAIEIPLPSIEVQRRIASILDAADALRAKRSKALEKLDTLTQSIFLDMFGPPDAPSVPCACLGELVRSPITRGVDQPGPDVKGGIPYIRTTDVTRGVTHRSELSTCSIEIAAPFSRSIVEYGDIVICIRATVGPTLRVGEALAGANLSRGTARIAPADSVRSEYLFAALNSEYFRRQVEGQLRGATFLQLPLGELRELSVPLPNLEQQDLFVDRWGAVERTMSQSVASLNHLNQLFLSLQHRAFRGEL